MPRFLVVLALFASTALVGCDGSDPEPGTLDDALASAIAGAGGPDAYLLPSADDLAAIPQDPRNPLTPEKVALGRLLFHETAMAVNANKADGMGMYSCASCHHAASGFQAGIPQGIGEGGIGFGRFGERRRRDPAYAMVELDTQPIRSPTVLNGAFQDVTLWNGQFGATGTNAGTESRWAAGTPIATNELGFQGLEIQAIAGLAVHRMSDGAAALYTAYPEYRALFDAAFPDRPAGERATAETAGLAVAAYERTVLADRAPFQRWLRGEADAMSSAQKRGAIVFFAEANCTTCHGGPALATGAGGATEFHAVGMGELLGPGVFSDFNPTDPVHLGRGGFTDRAGDAYTFKTPTLYNLADHGFFGHGATFNSVREVVDYKNAAVSQSTIVPADRLSDLFVPQNLSLDQIDDLVAFLEGGLYDADLARYVPDALPSGACFPNNDAETRADLGCGTTARAVPLSLLGRGRQTGLVM
ncbi:cytochrome-c peroxidase [Rubrivirga sp. IMCC45206]|uniref:cytochrome-c peroxidase n=1 Tax=Rubrivirga sp. IMCC45206 TaxID=3391614 RepID=UPI00398FCFDA